MGKFYLNALIFALVLCILQNVESREPGTLLLNMLTRDEAKNLDRTLPAWAKIIDYWIIGIDENNTDNSVDIIHKHLGHIPGHIEVVHFDGMGPTWTILVEKGLELFPEATHGIIADADFKPVQSYLDKMQLDVRCSKHMFTIQDEGRKNHRLMDWIYRNIPGAKVSRRTHQILEVPPMENQEVFQTLIDLTIEEREGGFSDRTGQKNERYIGFLKKDLEDYPGDLRTLYYLGYAHFDIFLQNKDNPLPEHWDKLKESVAYYTQRVEAPVEGQDSGQREERFFALLKLAEINERFYRNWAKAEAYYDAAHDFDPERLDPVFYSGQHYRLSQEWAKSREILRKAIHMQMPQRSLFQWEHMYKCLVHLEYLRALTYGREGDPEDFDNLPTELAVVKRECANDAFDLKFIEETAGEMLKQHRKSHPAPPSAHSAPSTPASREGVPGASPIDTITIYPGAGERGEKQRVQRVLSRFISYLDDDRQEVPDSYGSVGDDDLEVYLDTGDVRLLIERTLSRKAYHKFDKMTGLLEKLMATKKNFDCARYHEVAGPYLTFAARQNNRIFSALDKEDRQLADEWQFHHAAMHAVCAQKNAS